MPGRSAESHRFAKLQTRLRPMYERLFPDPQLPRSVLVVPSLSLDAEELAKISGVHHYEERMLCMLMLLRLPRTEVLYVTSQPIEPTVIDYMLHLLAGIPGSHARRRLHLFHCHDASRRPLTAKILERPRLVERLAAAIPDPDSAHMVCFNATPLERKLALRLGIPIYGCDPELAALGSKSGSRKLFRAAGVPLPDGREDLRDAADILEAIAALKAADPTLRRCVVKLNEGFSGEGNAVLDLGAAPTGSALRGWLEEALPRNLRYEAKGCDWERFRGKFEEMGGIVEAWVAGADKRSPSVQMRLDPCGRVEVISTHDQLLGGPHGQVFLGCTFPADPAYRLALHEHGRRIGERARDAGVLGRFGIDFISVRGPEGWTHRALEINLRKGGTTHPFMVLQYLTDGSYHEESGEFLTKAGLARSYYASDNLQSPRYRGLLPEDLVDIAVRRDLHFHAAAQTGVVFHLLGALSEFGKLGVVCIGEDVPAARRLYERTVEIFDLEEPEDSAALGSPPAL